MNAVKYFPPLPSPTGNYADQPLPVDTRFDWYLDFRCNFNGTGFLDAPATIPSGGTRALDSESVCLAVSHVWRERPGVKA